MTDWTTASCTGEAVPYGWPKIVTFSPVRWFDTTPASVDGALGGSVGGNMADEDDAVALDGDVGVDPGVSGAVEDAAIADEDVVTLRVHRNSE